MNVDGPYEDIGGSCNVDVPRSPEVPLIAQASSSIEPLVVQKTPRRTNPRNKKLSPRRRYSPRFMKLHVTLDARQTVDEIGLDCCDDEKRVTSSDDDTAEDETYKMDPNEMNFDDDIVVDSLKKRGRKRCPRSKKHDGESEVNVEEHELQTKKFVDDRIVDSDDSVEHDDVIANELLYDDEEMLEVRRASRLKRKENVRKSYQGDVGASGMDNDLGGLSYIANVGVGDGEGEETGVSEACIIYQGEADYVGSNASLDGDDANPYMGEMGYGEEWTDDGMEAEVDEGSRQGDTNQNKKVGGSNWPSFLTTYDGGYQSDERESDDEGALSDEDDEGEIVPKRKNKVKYPTFNELTDMRDVKFTIGMKFESRKILKEAIFWYSIQQHKDIIYIKNDNKRIYIGCAGCHWEISAGHDLEQKERWQIKSMQPIHKCVRTFKNRLVDDNWISKQYMEKIFRNPKIKPREIQEDIKERFEVVVGLRKCERAKDKALNAVENLMKKQYGILKPYLLELVRSNPGTTCVLKTEDSGTNCPAIFQRFYVCFAALKESLVKYCRPIIGVDGCFLKHACGGQLLCAVGRDGNNHMFPVAWAVVDRETKSSWQWFLRLVSEDLSMGYGEGWTVLSDQQKGLVPAIHEIWPNVEHRQCARHIYTNWRKVHKGNELHRQFWRIVKATSMGEFETESKKLFEMSKKAHEDFMLRDPQTFCKSHFKCHSSCDCVDNNMAETFNSFILLARYKPIVSMLEDIRLGLMDRMRVKRKMASKFVAGIAPRISQKLEDSYNEQKFCMCKWNGGNEDSGFEVIHNGIGHVVDLAKRSCSCRSWDLTGIPCAHGMSAILYMGKQPEHYVAKWYFEDYYNATYSTLLKPVPGTTFWDHEGDGMVLPPIIERKKMGRRKTARRRDLNEPQKEAKKISRKGIATHCSNCQSTEHTKRKCPLPPPPPKSQPSQAAQNDSVNTKKRGRPKGSKNRIGRPIEEIPPPAEYRRKLFGLKEKGKEPVATQGTSQGRHWLETIAESENSRASGRWKGGRGKGKGRSKGRPSGVGVLIGEGGQTVYMPTPNASYVIK